MSRNRITFIACVLLAAWSLAAQTTHFQLSQDGRPVPDAHNCYPDRGAWTDRLDRALRSGYPIGIEEDLAWHVNSTTGEGSVVVSHAAETTGSEPTLKAYFFERVRPIIEAALRENDRSRWPLIILHFDFKDNQEPLLRAVWNLLGEYEPWLTTAKQTADPQEQSNFETKPILVLTEDSDAQEKVFFREVPTGSKLRLFGSAHTNKVDAPDDRTKAHLLATVPPSTLLSEKPTNYRRWWNNSWYEVEEGGQKHAGDWTVQDGNRLRALVEHAHKLGFGIRFYTLDGFSVSENRGWGESYNFGSLEAAKIRWKAALDTGVDLIATDQYEELSAFMRSQHLR